MTLPASAIAAMRGRSDYATKDIPAADDPWWHTDHAISAIQDRRALLDDRAALEERIARLQAVAVAAENLRQEWAGEFLLGIEPVEDALAALQPGDLP